MPRVFVTVQSYLLAIYVRQLGVARSMKQSAVVKEDLFRMRVRLTRAAVKMVFLIAVHLHFGLMAPLVNSCLTAVVALPYWWDRESSYIAAKYGRRHGQLRWAAFAVALGTAVAYLTIHPEIDLSVVASLLDSLRAIMTTARPRARACPAWSCPWARRVTCASRDNPVSRPSSPRS